MRIGVIGIGVMGEYHTRVYSEIAAKHNDVKLVGIADVDNERVTAMAEKYGTTAYTDYNELIDQGLDAVSICVPTTMHKQVANAVMMKGVRGVLVEKPISNNTADSIEMINMAKAMRSILVIGHVERFNPAVILIKDIIDSGRLGKIVSISAKRVGIHPPRRIDTGVIIDLAVHDLDIICHLFGSNPVDIYAFSGQGKNNFEDRASMILKFSGQRAGLIDVNWLTPQKIRTLDIVGLDGVAHLDYHKQMININEEKCSYCYEDIDFCQKQEPLMKELLHFISVVKGHDKPLVTGEVGLRALTLALAALESSKTGKVYDMNPGIQ